MTSVYIAGASSEIERVEAVVAHARQLGLRVTYDWTVAVRQTAAAGKKESDLHAVELRAHATRDLVGVHEAAVVVLLAPAESSTGCWAELGYALGLGKRVVVSRERAQLRCIFETLAAAQCHSDAAAVVLAAYVAGVGERPEERP